MNEYRNRFNENNQESENLKRKIKQLLAENAGLGEEFRNTQENLRLSNAQQSKAFKELQEYQARLS